LAESQRKNLAKISVIGFALFAHRATALIVIALIVIARATEAGARRPEVSCAIDALA